MFKRFWGFLCGGSTTIMNWLRVKVAGADDLFSIAALVTFGVGIVVACTGPVWLAFALMVAADTLLAAIDLLILSRVNELGGKV